MKIHIETMRETCVQGYNKMVVYLWGKLKANENVNMSQVEHYSTTKFDE